MESARAELPAGIVTFVFTDVEGSTRLLRRLGPRYVALHDRQRELLRTAWAAHRGVEVNSEGDGSLVAFADTADALMACAAAQRAFGTEPWPADGVVRVRMGVHAGLASPWGDDYVALAVNQGARTSAAAHGGQVLLTDETAGRLAADALPGLDLVPLGRFRLRDFEEPVRLLQVAGDGLQASFPAVRALPAEAHNLVRPQNTFIGRADDVAELVARLRPGRLVSIVGPGGVGKTRLATEVGIEVSEAWADGVWEVDLAAVADKETIASAVSDAVGAPVGGADRWDDAVAHLRDRSALLILDNAESFIEHCAALVPALLRACIGVGVLATSREPLRVRDESVMRLAPLALPGSGAGADEGARSPAVELFMERAVAARAGFRYDGETASAVVAICQRLDGLPLALEIAAAHIAVLDPGSINAGLDDMSLPLRSSDRSRPERQQTMKNLLDWSYQLLTAGEQIALRRLSVFASNFSPAAAVAAVADDRAPADEVPELVWSLIDKSLMSADLTANGSRYRFLETVRRYGRQHLDASGETAGVATRLASWYLERLGPWRSADRTWISDTALELDNLRALARLVAPQDPVVAQQLACSIGRLLDAVQGYRAGIDELTRFAAEVPAATPSRVAVLTTLADLHLRVGDIDCARAVLVQAEQLQADLGAPPWDDVGVERATGEIATRTGDQRLAATIAEAALARPLSPRGRGRMWNLLGIARCETDDLPGAFDAFGAELAEHRAAGHEAYVASAEGNLAELALRQGDIVTAARHQQVCLELSLALGLPVLLAYSLMVAARIAVPNDWVMATRLHARARVALDDAAQRLYEADAKVYGNLLAQERAALGPVAFDRATAEGRSLDPLEASALASAVLVAAGTGPPPSDQWSQTIHQ